MTRVISILILIISTFSSSLGQTQVPPCDCPKTDFAGVKADTVFYLSNNKTIVLCGYKNPDIKPTIYSEFVLAVCELDCIIDFWSAIMNCRLKVSKDTLLVEQLQNLPTGKDFNYQVTVWITEKIYFIGQNVGRKLDVNRQINKYNLDQIKSVLKTYRTATQGIDESKMDIAAKLFIATISGDKTARQYFEDFKIKYALDGSFAEEYEGLTTLLEQWDKK